MNLILKSPKTFPLYTIKKKPLQELIDAEQRAVAANRGSADSREGMQAFLEKRKPVFNQALDSEER